MGGEKEKLPQMRVSITSQLGGPDASTIADKSLTQLAVILRDLENIERIVSLEALKLRTRIGGSIEDYQEGTGVHNVKVLKRYEYATAEIIVNRKDLTDEEGFHALYTDLLSKALDDLKVLLEKKEVLLDAEKYDRSIKDAILEGMKT